MLLTKRDLEKMENDVVDTIHDWDTQISLGIPKPIEQQSSWNPILHECTGPVDYDFITLPAERIDGFYTKQHVDLYGDRIDGSIVMYIPTFYVDSNNVKVPIDIKNNSDIRIQYDNDTWRINSSKKLIGEYLLNIVRDIGGE